MSTELPIEWIELCWSGELDPDRSRKVEAYLASHPDVWRDLALTEKLRRRIALVMKERYPAPPPDLAAAIDRELAQSDQADRENAVIARIGEGAIPRRGRAATRVARPARHLRWIGVAAALVLVAGAVLVGVFGQQIDFGATAPTGVRIVEAAGKVAGEHGMFTADRGLLVSTLTFHSPAHAEHGLSKALGVRVPIANLSGNGYTFIGAGVCKVPHCLNACHVVYRHRERGDLLVFHVVLDDGRLVLQQDPQIVTGGRVDVLTWSNGQVLYLLTSDDLEIGRAILEAVQSSA